MLLLPIEYVVYKTKLTEEEVIKRLEASIKQKKYQGEIIGSKFKISRVLTLVRNSFLPIIIGTMEKSSAGSIIIKVRMRLQIHVAIFMCFWFTPILCLFFTTGEGLDFLLFGYGLVMLGFKLESYSSIINFNKLFEAKIIKDDLTF